MDRTEIAVTAGAKWWVRPFEALPDGYVLIHGQHDGRIDTGQGLESRTLLTHSVAFLNVSRHLQPAVGFNKSHLPSQQYPAVDEEDQLRPSLRLRRRSGQSCWPVL